MATFGTGQALLILFSARLYAFCRVGKGGSLLLSSQPPFSASLLVPIPQRWRLALTHGSGYFLHSSLAGSVWYTVFCFPSELGLLCTILEHSICSSHEPEST